MERECFQLATYLSLYGFELGTSARLVIPMKGTTVLISTFFMTAAVTTGRVAMYRWTQIIIIDNGHLFSKALLVPFVDEMLTHIHFL